MFDLSIKNFEYNIKIYVRKKEIFFGEIKILNQKIHFLTTTHFGNLGNIGETFDHNWLPNVDPSRWVSYFSELHKKSESQEEFLESAELENSDQVLNRAFSLEGLKQNLNKLKNSKAPGIDGIRNEMIKCSSEEILELILAFLL